MRNISNLINRILVDIEEKIKHEVELYNSAIIQGWLEEAVKNEDNIYRLNVRKERYMNYSKAL